MAREPASRTSATSGSDVDSIVEDGAADMEGTDGEDEEDFLEPWVDWIRRTTHVVEEKLGNLGMDDWIARYRRAKWNFAATVVNASEDRWCKRVLMWQPSVLKTSRRRVGRPSARWDDAINNCIAKVYGASESLAWTDVAESREAWSELVSDFVYL